MSSKVSIVIPIYNAGKKLHRCLDSILNQTYSNLEIILIDDGSNDDSFIICKEYIKKDSRFILIHTENQGAGPARNKGISLATGRWIYFPDADDEMESKTIEIAVNAAERNKSDLVVFGFSEIKESGEKIRIKTFPQVTLNGDAVRNDYEQFYRMSGKLCIQGAPWNKLFALDIIKKYGIIYPSLRRHQDEAFICSYIGYATKICFIPDLLYTYYANDLTAVKRKYPINYIDSVIGLFEIRKKTILMWNPQNVRVKAIIYDELICNLIWAFELSFDKKYNFKKNNRIEWMQEKLKTINFDEIEWSLINKRPYQKVIVFFLQRNISCAHFLIHCKVFIQNLLTH